MSRAHASDPHRSVVPTRRLGAGLLVVLFLSGQLGGFVHQATVMHTRCPEHGELVHGGGEDGPQHAIGLAARADEGGRDGAPAEAHASPSPARHRHDHCLIACASRERVRPLDSVAVVAGEWPRSSLSPISPAADRAPAAALYRTAPKTSPPA